jgi:hypothetical protein
MKYLFIPTIMAEDGIQEAEIGITNYNVFVKIIQKFD